MASTWGDSWSVYWGNSWGDLGVVAPELCDQQELLSCIMLPVMCNIMDVIIED